MKCYIHWKHSTFSQIVPAKKKDSTGGERTLQSANDNYVKAKLQLKSNSSLFSLLKEHWLKDQLNTYQVPSPSKQTVIKFHNTGWVICKTLPQPSQCLWVLVTALSIRTQPLRTSKSEDCDVRLSLLIATLTWFLCMWWFLCVSWMQQVWVYEREK